MDSFSLLGDVVSGGSSNPRPKPGRRARAVMPSRQDQDHGPTRLDPTTGDSTRPRSRGTPFESASYHPTSVFRRLLNQSARDRKSTGAVLEDSSPQPAMARRAPGLLTFLGVAFLISVAS